MQQTIDAIMSKLSEWKADADKCAPETMRLAHGPGRPPANCATCSSSGRRLA